MAAKSKSNVAAAENADAEDEELEFKMRRQFLEKQGEKTKKIFQSAMKGMERKGRATKKRLTSEFRNAMEEVEKKKRKTKDILSKATTEILCAMEEKDHKKHKTSVCGGGVGGGGRVIPAEAVPHFRELYKYNATCGSVLELMFFQKFWIFLSRWIPASIAPCTITFSGLFFFTLNFCILAYYSADAKKEVPCWCLYLCAFAVFLYQTFDALDGKQCHAVQETHLEEFADHGCDSFASSLTTLSVAIALQLGDHPTLMVCFFTLNLATFYSTHWQTHVTDVVVFGKVDVTEAECAMIAVHLLTAVFGHRMWYFRLEWPLLLGMELRILVILLSMVAALLTIARNVKIIGGGSTPLDHIANIPRRRGINILYPFVPFALFLILIQLAAHGTNLLLNSPIVFCVTFGFVFSKLIVKLQISNLGKVDCDFLDSILFVPVLLCLNARLDLVPQNTALISALFFSGMDVFRFVCYLFWDVCDYQDIYVFSLKYPPGHPKNKAGGRGIYMNGINNEQVIARLKTKKNG